MKTLIIDNYDSFTYNLVQQVEQISGFRPRVRRNDEISFGEVDQADCLILSPGPGIPEEAGMLLDLIGLYARSKPILGVCLGHQAIAEAFGGTLENLSQVYHGFSTPVHTHSSSSPLFQGVSNTFEAGRYHSWVVDPAQLPDCLEVTCKDGEGRIMGLQHKELPIFGLQFHPESILTPEGDTLIANFLQLTKQGK